jgi:rSAM/selenodomain-associated transferase 1
VEGWLPGEDLWPQPSGDLGLRMAAAFDEAFRRGAARVVLVGTDLPFLAHEDVVGALEALARADVVLGPAPDGGYFLVALRRPHPELFFGITWSTPGVLAATRARAGALGLKTRLLDSQPDLDTLEDLHQHWARLSPLLAGDPELLGRIASALAARATRAAQARAGGSEDNRP